MIYGSFIPRLEGVLDSLGGPMEARFEDLLRCLRGAATEAADEACRRLARGQDLPPLSPPQRLEVCMRLSCGIWYCRTEFHRDLEGEGEPEFLDSLLIDYWRDVGRCSWLGEAFGATDGFAPEKEWMGEN